jgi:hypothetical protein
MAIRQLAERPPSCPLQVRPAHIPLRGVHPERSLWRLSVSIPCRSYLQKFCVYQPTGRQAWQCICLTKQLSSTIFAPKTVARLFLFTLLILFSTSCFNEADCIITATTAIKIDFKQVKINSTTLVKSVLDSALLLNYVKVSGIDTTYFKKVKASSVTLPINPSSKEVTYIFERNSASGAITKIDSIKFSYSDESRVLSAKCGAFTYFLNLKVTSTSFDSTKYKLVNNRLLKGATNVQIFF